MKKGILAALAIVVALAVVFLFTGNKSDEKKADEDPKPITVGHHSGPFNESFSTLLNSYYAVKDALVQSDTAAANRASVQLKSAATGLKVDEISGDTSGTIRETARSFASTIGSSADAFVAKADIEEKRKELEIMTDAMFNLSRVVKFDGEKIYYQYCPMAFNDKGAYWLSRSTEIKNPYFGEKMLTCGSTEDSLDYTKR